MFFKKCMEKISKRLLVEQVPLMTEAHDFVLDELNRGSEHMTEAFYRSNGEITPELIDVKAIMGARQKVIKCFFDICVSKNLSVVFEDDGLYHIPDQYRNRVREIYKAEMLRLISRIRGIYSQNPQERAPV